MTLPEGIKKLNIIIQGKSRLIIPEGSDWDSFFAGPSVTDDFMTQRNQPDMQE